MENKVETARWKQRVRVFEFIYMCLINEITGKEVTKAAFEDYDFDNEQNQVVEQYAKSGDEYIQQITARLSKEWTWKRIPPVERAIMLEAMCEQHAWQTPKSVLIDQAVTTAKHYADDESYKFVNAVLEQVLS